MLRQALLFSYALALSAAPTLDVWSGKSDIRTVEPTDALKLISYRQGDFNHPRLNNTGRTAVHVKEVVLFRIVHDLPDDTRLYGESFQMLSQTAGTLGKPVNLGYDELANMIKAKHTPANGRVATSALPV